MDITRFKGCTVTKEEKRVELGIPQDAFVLLSVGELSSRKNHQVVIRAISEIQDNAIYYLIAGTGEDGEKYAELAENGNVAERVLLLGARTDVDELCAAADVFVHPSVREGLGIAPLEGMAAGLPLIASYINGIKDYTEEGITGCCIQNPLDVTEMKNAILKLKNNELFREECGKKNIEIVEKFSLSASKATMAEIYAEIAENSWGVYHLLRILKRAELGINSSDYMLFSAGELNQNKNHKIIIEALGKLQNSKIHYVIAGQGEEKAHLEKTAEQFGLKNNIHFLGYREDIRELLFAADVFCFPSKREGLGLAAIEALASGLPIVGMNTRGIQDYVIDRKTGYLFNGDSAGCACSIQAIFDMSLEEKNKMKEDCIKKAQEYSVIIAEKVMRKLYMY